jgi:hypothetical protein
MRLASAFMVLQLTTSIVSGDTTAPLRTGDMTREEEILRAIAYIIPESEGQVNIEPSQTPGASWETVWSFSVSYSIGNVKHRAAGEVRYDEELHTVTGITISSRIPRSIHREVGQRPPAEIRSLAERTLSRCTTFDLRRMREQAAQLVAHRIWAFTWEETALDGVTKTGGRAGVGISAMTAEVVSYHVYYAREPASRRRVETTAEIARAKLGELLSQTANDRYRITAEELYLSSPLAGGGPIWSFTIVSSEGNEENVVLDATTGEFIYPRPPTE